MSETEIATSTVVVVCILNRCCGLYCTVASKPTCNIEKELTSSFQTRQVREHGIDMLTRSKNDGAGHGAYQSVSCVVASWMQETASLPNRKLIFSLAFVSVVLTVESP
jgi:hypothetical protein